MRSGGRAIISDLERTADMSNTLRFWLIWFGFLLLIDVLFPFFLLAGIPHAKGSFLFWTCWTLLAIGSMFVIFLRWRDAPTADEG